METQNLKVNLQNQANMFNNKYIIVALASIVCYARVIIEAKVVAVTFLVNQL